MIFEVDFLLLQGLRGLLPVLNSSHHALVEPSGLQGLAVGQEEFSARTRGGSAKALRIPQQGRD